MDPSTAELAGFANLEDAIAWVGIPAGTIAALREAIGDFQLLREIVLIPRAAWDEAVAAARIPGADAQPGRALRALELGQVESLRRVARLRLGLPAEEEGLGGQVTAGVVGGTVQAAVAGAGAAAAAAGAAAPVVGGARKFKMSTVFDQGDDSEVHTWTPARLRTVMAAFKATNDGEDPEQDEEASADQLAALEHRLASGACPCPDFGVWRPYGHRLARALKLTVHHITPGGDYVPYEVAGPPSFNEWLAAYRVFSVAMRALRAATTTRLLMYQNKIQKLNETYGHVCWWLVAQADQRMRAEHLERIRRRAEEERAAAIAAGGVHPFDPAVPWDYCLKAATLDRHFWEEELDRKCMLYITHLKSQKQLTDDGHGVDLPSSGSRATRRADGGAPQGAGAAKRQRPDKKSRHNSTDQEGNGGNDAPRKKGKAAGKGGKQSSKGQARLPDGRWRSDDKGREICWLWNRAEDGCSDICPNTRSHVCEWCRSFKHKSVRCPQKPPGWVPGDAA